MRGKSKNKKLFKVARQADTALQTAAKECAAARVDFMDGKISPVDFYSKPWMKDLGAAWKRMMPDVENALGIKFVPYQTIQSEGETNEKEPL